MEATMAFGGTGWFSDRQTSTGASSGLTELTGLNRVAILAATILLGAGTGTGAFIDDLDWWQQHQLNKADTDTLKPYTIDVAPARSPAEDLERIREVFSPAVSDLANAFGVSRQTIYNWLNGEQPKPEHIAKLMGLAQAADLVSEAGLQITGALLKRQIIGGKNLFEIVCAGGSARDAAQIFLRIMRREAAQRERMTARFTGRTTSFRSAESDFPAENDDVG